MSELLHLIRSVFVFLIDLTVDCMCLVAYLFALLSGVRTIPAIRSIDRATNRKKFREEAVTQFLMAIYDFVVYSFFLVSLLVPWRSIPVIASVIDMLKAKKTIPHRPERVNYEVRRLMMKQAYISLGDIIAVPVMLLPLLFPWRTWKVIKVYQKTHEKYIPNKYNYNGDLRSDGFMQLLFVLIDIPTILFGLLGLLIPWRTYFIIKSLFKIDNREPNPDTRYNKRIRGVAIIQTLTSVYDVILFIMIFIMVITVYKIPNLWKIFKKEEGVTYDEDMLCSYSKRFDVVTEFLIWCLDIFFLPVVAFLLITWRAPKILSILKDKNVTFLQRRFRCMRQIFFLIVDIPFALMALFVALTLWRLPALYRDMKKANSASVYRKCCARQFVFFFTDIPIFILFFINCAFVYPIPSMVAKMITLSKQPILTGKPALTIASYRIEACAEGGYRLHIRGSKEAMFTFQNAKLYVLGDPLWDAASRIFGSGKIFVAKSVFPIELVPESLAPSSIPAELTEFETQVKLGVGNPRLSKKIMVRLLGNLKALNPDIDIHIHAEYDNQTGILFDIHLKSTDILSSLESSELSDVPDIPKSDGKEAKVLQYYEIFFNVVIEQTILLLRDIAGLLGIIRLLLQPHKFWEAFQSFYESPERQTARKLKESFSALKPIFRDMDMLQNEYNDMMERCLSTKQSRQSSQYSMQWCIVGERYLFDLKVKMMTKIFKYIQSTGCAQSSLIDDIKKYTDELAETRFEIIQLQYLMNGNVANSPNPEQDMIDLRSKLCDTRRLLKDTYDSLSNTEVQIPEFWATASNKHRSWSDKCAIVFSIVYQSTLDFFGFIGLLFLTITVFRFIPAMKNIVKDRHFWRSICFFQIIQLFADVLFFFMYLIVVVLVRYSLVVTLEAATELYVTRDVKSARDAILNRLSDTLSDILYLFSFLTAWKTYKYILAIAVWGLLGPADMFSGLLAYMNVPKNIRKPISIILWLGGLVAAPVIVFKIIHNSDDEVDAYRISIKIYLSYVAVMLVPILYYSSKEKSALEKDEDSVEYHYNIYNMFAVVHLFVETYQNIAVVWKVDDGSFDNIGSPAFLTFDDWWLIAFRIALAVTLLWFFLISAPMVVEEMLSIKTKGYFARNPLWASVLFLSGRTLMFYVTVSFLNVLDCKEIDGVLVLNEDATVECFTSDGNHSAIATIALVSLAFYIPTTADASIRYFSANVNKDLDVSFTSFYVIAGIIYNILVAALRVFNSDRDIGLALLIAMNGFMFLFTVSYSKLFASDCTPLPVMVAIRSCSYAFPLISAIIQFRVDTHFEKDKYAEIFVPVCAFVFVVLFTIGIMRGIQRDKKSGVLMLSRADMKTITSAFCAIPKSLPPGTFMDSWSSFENTWIRKIQLIRKPPHPLCSKCNRASELASLLLLLDSYTKHSALYPNFIASRASWRQTTEKATTIGNVLLQAREYVAGVRGAGVLQIPNIPALNPTNAQLQQSNPSPIVYAPPPVISSTGQQIIHTAPNPPGISDPHIAAESAEGLSLSTDPNYVPMRVL